MKVELNENKITVVFGDGITKTMSIGEAKQIADAVDLYYGIEDVVYFIENDTNDDGETWEDVNPDVIDDDDFINRVANTYVDLRHEYDGDNECHMGWRDALEEAFKKVIPDYPKYKEWWDNYV